MKTMFQTFKLKHLITGSIVLAGILLAAFLVSPQSVLSPKLDFATTPFKRSSTVHIATKSASIAEAAKQAIEQDQSNRFILTDDTNADLTITEETNQGDVISQRVYVLGVAFNTLSDGITMDQLIKLMQGDHVTVDGKDWDTVLLNNVTSSEILALTGSSSTSAHEVKPDEVRGTLNDHTIIIMPFEALTKDIKVLTIDNKNILDKNLDLKEWPLTLSTRVTGKTSKELVEILKTTIKPTNRDTQLLSNIVFTGVTAISRGVEYEIQNRNDPMYPARGVMDVLSKADITHIDHENPLFDTCKPEKEGIVLCGKTASMAAIKAIGTDIADLTGNHQNDYGPDKNKESMQHLTDAGIDYFGGGKNEEEAKRILYKEINGTKIGFIGYNYFDSLNGPQYVSLARGDRPGANYYTEEKLKAAVEEARKNADVVVVDYQFIETYSYQPITEQVNVFRKTIDFGADIVVGVQSHQPQRIEFYNGKVIFYGLGNFFFDQMWSYPTRQGIIPRITFYDGKIQSIEVLTTLLYDYSQPRFTTGSERQDLLKVIAPPTPVSP